MNEETCEFAKKVLGRALRREFMCGVDWRSASPGYVIGDKMDKPITVRWLDMVVPAFEMLKLGFMQSTHRYS
jgi:hypothetical protein